MHGRGGANAVQRGHDLGDHGFGNRTVRFDGAPRVRAAAAPDGGGDHPGRAGHFRAGVVYTAGTAVSHDGKAAARRVGHQAAPSGTDGADEHGPAVHVPGVPEGSGTGLVEGCLPRLLGDTARKDIPRGGGSRPLALRGDMVHQVVDIFISSLFPHIA